jgi:O-succinylbenzoate synthase
MKLESFTLYHISMPLVVPFETSFGVTIGRECIIISIQSEGLTGWGECAVDRDPGYCYETTGTAWHILKDFICPPLLGDFINDAVDFQRRVEGIRGHNLAKAGVEMALWDLVGKRLGKSLCEILGGQRSRVPVGVSVGLQANPEALVEMVGKYLAGGYGRIKIKIKPGRDVGDTEAVRKAHSPAGGRQFGVYIGDQQRLAAFGYVKTSVDRAAAQPGRPLESCQTPEAIPHPDLPR